MAMNLVPASWRERLRHAQSLVGFMARFAGRRGIVALIYVTLGAFFESIGLVLLIPLFGLVINNGGGHGFLSRAMNAVFASVGVTSQFGRLSVMLAVFAGLMIVRGIVISARDIAVQSLQIEFIDHLRGQIATALAEAGWDGVLRLHHARILSILSGDIQRITGTAHFLLQAGISVVILIAQCILSFLLSPGLALFAFGLLIVSAIGMVPILRRARGLGRYMSLTNMTLLSTTTQFLSGLKLALSQDLQGSFVAEYRSTLQGMTSRQLQFLRLQTSNRVILTTLSALVGAAVILVGYGFLHLSAPLLIAFLLVVARMSGPATQIQQGLQQFAQGLPSYETVMQLLGELHASAAPTTTAARPITLGPIMLDHARFEHASTDGSGSHGVRDISVTIAPGTFVGVAGTSGAGKTTFADLLVGLLRSQSGSITVGGTLLDDHTLGSWRAQLSYISQDPFLFHDTVRHNLKWAQPNATEAEMWEALTLAGADSIVRGMQGGLDAIVGERGSLVSGGERQRIALARALLRRPKVLVMDEATNAIDIAGERALLERLSAISPRLTIILIAHRAESLALCDRVLQIESGLLASDSEAAPALARHS